jgi:glycosyltransferase involved in cell wall biosynthesis
MSANSELIICDDDSSDQTPNIIRKYADQDARIKFTANTKRLGLFENYNQCITQAKNQYIKPFAQDDLLCAGALTKMSAALDNNPHVRLVSGARQVINANGKETERIATFSKDTVLTGKEVTIAHLITLSNWVGEPSSVMFRADSKGKMFDPDFYHYGDIDYWLRILEGGSFFYLSEPVCAFRRHAKSTTSSNLNGLYFACDIFRLGAKYEHYLNELGESPEHFGQRATEVIARHIDHLVCNQSLTTEKMLAARPGLANYVPNPHESNLRTALFYAERRVTGLLKDLIAVNNKLEHKEDECRRLREAYNQLSNSLSWRLTAPLRNFRALLFQSSDLIHNQQGAPQRNPPAGPKDNQALERAFKSGIDPALESAFSTAPEEQLD